MKFASLIIPALLATVIPAAAVPLSQQDTAYLTSAMQEQLGRYALATMVSRSGSGAVQSYARNVVKDAAANTTALDALAKRDGVAIPKGPNTLDDYHYSQMQGLHGSRLDQEFVDALRADVGMEQDNVKTEMTSGQDPSVKAFAKKRYSAMQHEATQLKQL
ncbi:MAG TPA: DUF4142 domain-containing protein [Candidatus Baltobacteraceae bacterium]|nr:DUF4142 domain-containing protein [Candidatus Baltobacteraceae bacterium]